jgi:hypothetical protein
MMPGKIPQRRRKWASYLKPFRNGDQLKSRNKKLQIARHKETFSGSFAATI